MTRSFMKGCDRVYIDIVSLIIGCILWEVLKSYVSCRLIPEVKITMDKINNKEKVEAEPDKQHECKGGIKGTTWGLQK